MADATVTINSHRAGNALTPSIVDVTIGGNGYSYATSTGGLAFDLRAALTAVSGDDIVINGNDVIKVVPAGCTTGKYLCSKVTVGTITATAIPCTVRFYGKSGSIATEVDDGANSDTFDALVFFARNGAN